MNREIEKQQIHQLLEQQKRIIAAGNELADRALYTTREYDGIHRLGSAVAKWIDTLAKINNPKLL